MFAILQPLVPHYRQEFFNKLCEQLETSIYCYERNKKIIKQNLKQGRSKDRYIHNIEIGPVLLYNPIPFLKKSNSVMVLMLNFSHITTWLLLLFKFLHKKKIILWGHGISVKRYIKEEKKPSVLLKWMIRMADEVWFYTDKEMRIWKDHMPNLKAISLNNTTFTLPLANALVCQKEELKNKYHITQPIVFIFCARFNNSYRRIDLLEKTVKEMNADKFGFILIGDGPVKPDFSDFKNVYDFGALYDSKIKAELFTIADLYYQPAWVGLSIVEAMGYGKPVLTYKRSKKVKQCVEYHYLIHKYNGLILDDHNDFLASINLLNKDKIAEMSNNALQYVRNNLSIENMTGRAISSLQEYQKHENTGKRF